MNQTLSIASAKQFLRAVTVIGDRCDDMAERRQALLEELASITKSDAGHWAWGRGRPENDRPIPLAFIHFGYSKDELAAFLQFGLDPQLRENFNLPLLALMRDDNISCGSRRDILPDDQWNESNWLFRSVRSFGKDSWMHAVRYESSETWSNIFLTRNIGAPQFSQEQLDVLDLAISSIPWLWANSEEMPPKEKLAPLSPRQRGVMFLALGGLSRKMIARQLGIGEETVNHHMKSVFRHFGVQSAIELSALFLRRQ